MAAVYPDSVVFFVWRLFYYALLSFVIFVQGILFHKHFKWLFRETTEPLKQVTTLP